MSQEPSNFPHTSRGLKSVPFHLRTPETWPIADTTGLNENDTSRFERFRRAITIYFSSNGSLKLALDEAKCTKEVFYTQLERCLATVDTSGTIVGWAGVIKYKRVKNYDRRSDGPGHAGKFEKWLSENQGWRQTINQAIRMGNGGEKIKAKHPTVSGVAGKIVALIKNNVPIGTYPNNSKSCGRKSIERYVKNHIALNPKVSAVWFGESAANKQNLGTGHFKFLLETAPFDKCATDAHTLDAIGIVILPGPAGPQRVPVTRLKIIPIICLSSRVITGYSACIKTQICAADVEQAYLMGTTKWEPLNLTIPGLKYRDGAGFPCGIVDGITEVNFSALQLDNACQHFGKGIQQRLRKSLGCAISWGAIGSWWRNAITERFFMELERRGFKRLPSTMGTGPTDPLRGDPIMEATGLGIEWGELIQLLDVLIANYNATPHGALGGRSPLEVVRDSIGKFGATCIPRTRPPYGATTIRPGIEIAEGIINGYVEKRINPYVEVDETRYSGPGLVNRYDLLGKPVFLHIPKDMRTIEAFLQTGESLGVINCLHQGWNQSPHSRQERKTINALKNEKLLSVSGQEDPITIYLNSLAKKAYDEAQLNRVAKISLAATLAAELSRTSHQNPNYESATPTEKIAANSDSFQKHFQSSIKLPDKWK